MQQTSVFFPQARFYLPRSIKDTRTEGRTPSADDDDDDDACFNFITN